MVIRTFPWLAVLVLSLACDPSTPQQQQSNAPTMAEWHAANAAKEAERSEKIEAERADYWAGVDEAWAAFEAAPGSDTFDAYTDALIRGHRLMSDDASEELDMSAQLEALTIGPVVSSYLEELEGKWAKKNNRTSELCQAIHAVYAARVDVREASGVAYAEGLDDAALVLAYGVYDDWEVGGVILPGHQVLIHGVDEELGDEGLHLVCRAALDQVLAEDRKKGSRRNYVFTVCSSGRSDWDEQLAQWASDKETKAFRKAYNAYRGELATARDAKVSDEPQPSDSGSSSSGNDDERGGNGASAPASSAQTSTPVTLRNTCGQTVGVFYGEDPKFGSGKTSSLNANSRQNAGLMKVGAVVWLLDEDKKGIASARVSASTRELVFTCTGVSAR